MDCHCCWLRTKVFEGNFDDKSSLVGLICLNSHQILHELGLIYKIGTAKISMTQSMSL